VLPKLAEAVRGGAMVAWVRNTVDEAQRAFLAARSLGISVRLFHARFRARDRQRVEDQVLADYGPSGTRDGSLLIATQVVEQSLDLDFDLLATDVAPIDLLLQRIGRLHRHQKNRPEMVRVPRVIVVEPPAPAVETLEFGPSSFVYDPATLWLSHDSLHGRSELSLPADIRALVEDTYDPELRASRLVRARNRTALEAKEEALRRDLDAREAQARRACIPPAAFDSGSFPCFNDDDETVRALTRDGESATLLLALWDGQKARSLEGGAPWSPDAASPDAWRLARNLLEETVSVRAYPWERLKAGEHGVARDRHWQEWRRGLDTFLAASDLSAVVVPVVREGDDFMGLLESDRRRRELRYRTNLGLWFPKGATS
jgi:CRISPR-associated endonuclease/helicase Cas3